MLFVSGEEDCSDDDLVDLNGMFPDPPNKFCCCVELCQYPDNRFDLGN